MDEVRLRADARVVGDRDVFLEGRLAAEPAPALVTVAAEVLKTRVGVYRHTRTVAVLEVDVVDGVLQLNGRRALLPVDDRIFLLEPFPAIRGDGA